MKLGYSPYELVSALQKDIRRGNEYQALFWAVKMESFDAERLWRKLKAIASEDVSCGNPIVPLVIETLEKQYWIAIERKNDSYRLFLANAVVILCKSPKSRMPVHLVNYVYGQIQYEDKRLSIPDYALDIHLEGKEWEEDGSISLVKDVNLTMKLLKTNIRINARRCLRSMVNLEKNSQKERKRRG